ncbi:bifunctional proline dehydrogenase/L-glutamate gamma-semialdehyde dehydrogenase PutA [Primorskyibacter sp. S187A]|uniref:bifunctional proline dehydrogenase/L-glutamate gamma-semialdehyde dehydrogenase PutA n=1 Tax=Primorskyibacter sp. S187A TaxID=3415130 RepID=UPI003C7B13F3
MTSDTALRDRIDMMTYTDEAACIADLVTVSRLSLQDRSAISKDAEGLVTAIRTSADPGLMEVFLAEYGLSTDEGVALMCLAEALLRVPDAETIDALIEDKIAPSDWGKHLGSSTSSLVNASTWALMLTGRVLSEEQPGPVGHLRAAIRRLGEPVIRTAVARAMKEMGRQFVLGETIGSAMSRGAAMEAKGYTYSYDMLGEAARTDRDAKRYFEAYRRAIAAIGAKAQGDGIADRPGISVKLSALHPRYEEAQRDRVMQEALPRLIALCEDAARLGIGLNIDAEEADRLSLSLDLIAALLTTPSLAQWPGLGVVVQAYGPRASAVIDWLYAAAQGRRIMVRLVKGAYWDTEIKRAQVEGLDAFPVFTSKAATDVSYIANARKLLDMRDRLYPQFATHNAHTVAAILHMAQGTEGYEFQRLHGMGEALHAQVKASHNTRCRIYAPVGAHRDLLAYLVRRLLENGANSSFVNQIVDEDVPPSEVARDPFLALDPERSLPKGTEIYQPERRNSGGADLAHRPTLAAINAARAPYRSHVWGSAGPQITDPADGSHVGHCPEATDAEIDAALHIAQPWSAEATARAEILNKAADLYETHQGELFALLAREAGKTLPDALAELREAVDFLRYYAAHAPQTTPVGRFTCISPWNFPLAIFTGQIAAALATGNAVLAKPAPQTPLVAERAVALLHEAGVPGPALQILPGGVHVGRALTSDPRVDGVAFTGSTATARAIRRSMADHLAPGAPLIAETGGLNAMIVDSTALPEQAVASIVESAFQSAGQRCSALRCLYVQEDIAENFTAMLTGAMAELRMGHPWEISTDVGPVIDVEAREKITKHIEQARNEGRLIAEGTVPPDGNSGGTFVAPTLLRVSGIEEMQEEIFGPVLHLATFRSDEIDSVISRINATGYGLTFGLHTRIDDRVQHVTERVHAGNIYVNRNQIGAVVGSQPFGGEGLSGTGPKAGGPLYLARFCAAPHSLPSEPCSKEVSAQEVQTLIDADNGHPATIPEAHLLPGPTGESNRYMQSPRPPLLCLGPGPIGAQRQAEAIRDLGGRAITLDGALAPEALSTLQGFSGALWWGDALDGRRYAQALAKRDGPILPLITGLPDRAHACHERHVCVDTTASGGNAELLAGES